MAFGSDANTLTASADLTWNNTNKYFTLTNGAGSALIGINTAGYSYVTPSSGHFDVRGTPAYLRLTNATAGTQYAMFGHDGTNFTFYTYVGQMYLNSNQPGSVSGIYFLTRNLFRGGVDRIGNWGFGTASEFAATSKVHINLDDAATSTAGTILTISHNSSGTPTTGFGESIALNLESSTTADQSAAAISTLWIDATHATRKAALKLYAYDTAQRLGVTIQANGTTADVLIDSLIYGSMYADDINQAVVVSATGTYYEVPGSITGGTCNGFTFQSSKQLLCTIAGKYLVTWSMSLDAGNNDHIAGAVMVNSTVAANTENAAHTPGAGDQVPVGGSGIITLAVNDVVKFCVENESDTDDINVTHATLSILRVGA